MHCGDEGSSPSLSTFSNGIVILWGCTLSMTSGELEDFWLSRMGKLHDFIAIYSGWESAKTSDMRGRFMRLENIYEKRGIFFRDHLWLAMGKRFRQMGLVPGQYVQFRAKPNRYRKARGQQVYGGQWLYLDPSQYVVQLELTNITDFATVDIESGW